jgi:signal transduction histidine kinase
MQHAIETGASTTVLPFQFATLESGQQPLNESTESLSALGHDARNMVTALGIYCEILERPGVLANSSRHLADELKLITGASRRLVEQINRLGKSQPAQLALAPRQALPAASKASQQNFSDSTPIQNLARELRANQNLLAALAGPAIQLRLRTTGGEAPVRLRAEELTRILVNLVRNSAEAMPDGGELDITLCEVPSLYTGVKAHTLLLTVSDSGPGIAEELREAVFSAGFTGHAEADPDTNWQGQHRGLGLAITRAILESASGNIQAVHSNAGARFEIRLPIGA